MKKFKNKSVGHFSSNSNNKNPKIYCNNNTTSNKNISSSNINSNINFYDNKKNHNDLKKIKEKLLYPQRSINLNKKCSSKYLNIKKQTSNITEKEKDTDRDNSAQLHININNKNNTQKYSHENAITRISIQKTNSDNNNSNNVQSDNSLRISGNEKIFVQFSQIKENYEKKIFNYQLEIQSLLQRNDKLEELVLKLKDTLDKANEIFPDFLEQLINNNNSKNNNSMVSEGEDPISILENTLKNKKNNNDFEKKNDMLTEENEKLMKSIEILNNNIQKLESEINDYKKAIMELRTENYQNIFQINTLTDEIQQKCEEKKIVEEKILQSNNIKKECDLLINDLKIKLEEKIIENNGFKSKNETLIEENKNLKVLINENVKDYENKFDYQEKELNKLNEDLINKKNIIIQINKTNEKLLSENKHFSEEIVNLNQQIKNLKENNNNLVIEKEELLAKLKNNSDKEEKNNLYNQLNSLTEEKKSIQDNYINLEKEFNNIVNENTDLKNQICTLNDKILLKSNEISKNNDFTKSNENYEKMKIHEEQIKMLTLNLNTKVAENQEYQTMISDLKTEINNLSLKNVKDNTEYENKTKSLFEEIKTQKIKIYNLNNINVTLNREISSLKITISNLKKNQVIEHRTVVADEEFNELVDENEELKKINKELIDKINEFSNSNRTKATTENILLNENETSNDNKQNLIIAEQKEEIDSLRSRFEQLYRELNQYRLRNSDLNSQIKKMQENSLNDSRNSKTINSANEESPIFKLKKNLSDEIEKLTFKLNDIEDENNKLKELLKQSHNELEVKNKEINFFKEKLIELDINIDLNNIDNNKNIGCNDIINNNIDNNKNNNNHNNIDNNNDNNGNDKYCSNIKHEDNEIIGKKKEE